MHLVKQKNPMGRFQTHQGEVVNSMGGGAALSTNLENGHAVKLKKKYE